jgi:hypothetical protein
MILEEIIMYKMTANESLEKTKAVISEALETMGFQVFEDDDEITATRGSKLATALIGPLAGKKKSALKLLFEFSQRGEKTDISMADGSSGIAAAVTSTEGTTRRAMQDVYDELIEMLKSKDLI